MFKFFGKNYAIIIIVITVILAGIFYFGFLNKNIVEKNNIKDKNTETTSEILIIENNNIKIESPKRNDVLNGVLILKGESNKPFTVNLKDLNDTLILTVGIEEGKFDGEYLYAQPTTTDGVLEIENERLPIKFNILSGEEAQIFFSNINKDPELNNCSIVYPAIRHISNKNPPLGALISLLVGPNREEKTKGYFTNLPLKVIKINNFEIKNKIAYVDFSKELGIGVAGSCRVQAIRSQITNTLTQFEDIDKVIISINSEIDEILQP